MCKLSGLIRPSAEYLSLNNRVPYRDGYIETLWTLCFFKAEARPRLTPRKYSSENLAPAMELRSLLLLVAGAPAVLGFQAAMRVGAMKPAMAVRASTAMLVDPAMLDAAAIVDAPMQLLALKSEADEVIDELFGLVYPVGTAIGLGVRRRPPPFSGHCASRRPGSTG